MEKVSGYVLAGGASTRMGTDKALIELAGAQLIEHAVGKLRRICADVHILSKNAALSNYAPLVPDLHPGCGPMSGIEAALANSRRQWILALPVDLPFLPVTFLQAWVERITDDTQARVAYCEVEGKPHPALALVRCDMRSQITASLDRGEYKLMPAFQSMGPRIEALTGPEAQRWFANLNTPADLEAARQKARQRVCPGAS